jgi:hypothetical protein
MVGPCDLHPKAFEGVGVLELSEDPEAFEAVGAVIRSISSTERGEVFYRPTDWLGSCDPLTHIQYTRGSSTGLAD